MSDRIRKELLKQEEKQLVIRSMDEAPNIIHAQYTYVDPMLGEVFEMRKYLYRDQEFHRIIKVESHPDQVTFTYTGITLSDLEAIHRATTKSS